ncbi:MAG: cytochrome b/b6 domain-containing protein [Gemmatirosa sp.]|nr:cytochrome b/b6 domain-containing protein [Gemmatirosa sp.]
MRSKVRHHWVVRVTHWAAALAILIMVTSGLRIFNAYPAFHRKGETFCCYPFEGKPIPAWLTFGGWLAGARHWHFAAMWLLVATGVVYVLFDLLRGDWRDLVPRRGDGRRAVEMVRFYLFLRRDHPVQGKHNTLQKLAYFALPVVTALVVLSGLAIWKPVSLGWLTSLFGGYVWARYWHFVGMVVVALLALGHVFMIFAVDPYAIPSMITGAYDERLSPESRNARPFYHLLPKWARPAPHEPAPNATPATEDA